MKYKYIIFDCDGVLVDSEHLACSTLSEMLSPFGATIDPYEIMSGYVGMKDIQVIEILKQKFNLQLPADFNKQYETELDKRLEKNLPSITGIEIVLNFLKVPVALVSNSNYNRILTSIKSAGLYHFFDEAKIFSPDLAHAAKPDPKIYLYALAQLGISAKEAIVIEDSPTGVKAASGAGIEVIGFLGAAHVPGQEQEVIKNGAGRIAHNTQELSAIFKELNLI